MTQQASGFTTDYTDPATGMNLPEAWVEITNILYVPYGYVLIVYDIYKDLASYQSNMSPVFSNLRGQVNQSSTDWGTYFDPDTMDQALHNIQKQVISWLEANISNLKR